MKKIVLFILISSIGFTAFAQTKQFDPFVSVYKMRKLKAVHRWWRLPMTESSDFKKIVRG